MRKSKNYMTFRKPRTRAIRALNNLYVINTIARNSLKEAKQNLKSHKNAKLHYEVPVVSGETIVVARRKSKIISLLKEAINRDLYSQTLIAAVATTEDYLSKSLTTILTWYPQKLSSGEGKKVDFSLVLESEDIDKLIQKVIFNQIYSIFHSSPIKYFEALKKIFAINFSVKLKQEFSEVKATRDLLVHNSGVINSLYLKKSGKLARGKEGEIIPLNESYFNNGLRCMKKVVTTTYSQLLKKYGNRNP